jgi:hypothetical protein
MESTNCRSAADFRKQFSLVPGKLLPGIPRVSSDVGHVVEQQNERYAFPSKLTLDGIREGGVRPKQTLLAKLKKLGRTKHIV